ncbi:MAG: ArsR family transcriptional regulator, partial [Cellvibrionales bacterium]|nr:ArsR family transcriptional regulator [Cellvibrionales bacterium]
MVSESNIASLAPAPSLPPLPTLFKALGDDLRVQVLRLLKDESLNVSELCEVFQLRQSALSHHLKVLVQANLLARKKEGTVTFYRRQVPEGEQQALLEEAL